MPRQLKFAVHGIPRPQGSKSLIRGVMVEASVGLPAWRSAVTKAARDAHSNWNTENGIRPEGGTFFGGAGNAVSVDTIFVFQRPKSHYRTGRYSQLLKPSAPHFHTQKPDVDKLPRAILDAVTKADVWLDDCYVSHLSSTRVWVDLYSGIPSGVRVTITEITKEGN